MREPPEPSELTGATNLLAHYRLAKLFVKKKNDLDINFPFAKADPGGTLKSLLETRIIGNKEILPLNATQQIGFRLMPGQLPAQYRFFNQVVHKKHKKHKKKHKNQTHDFHPPGDAPGPSDSAIDPTNIVERKKKDKKKEKKKEKKDKKEKKRKIQANSND